MRCPNGRTVDLHHQPRIHCAQARDLVMGIGAEGYANIGPLTIHRRTRTRTKLVARPIPVFQHADAQTSKAAEKSPSEDQNMEPKRALSPSAVDEKNFKRARASTWLDGGGDSCDASVASAGLASRAVTEPFNKPEQSKASAARTENPKINSMSSRITNVKVNGDDIEILDERPATSSSKHDESVELDPDELLIIHVRPATPALKRKASATPSSYSIKKPFKTVKHKDNEHKATPTSVKEPTTRQKVNTGKSATASKSRRAKIDDPESEDVDSESEKDEDEEESEWEEDPKAPKQFALAKKDLETACRKCKANASKAMKKIHEAEISKLKKEHKEALSTAKAEAAERLKSTKVELKKKNDDQKTKHAKKIKELKDDYCEKVEDLKEKQEEATDGWDEKTKSLKKDISDLKAKHAQDAMDLKDEYAGKVEDLKEKRDTAVNNWVTKYKNMKQKLTESNTKLTKEKDEADAKRKESEKETHNKINDMTNDTEAAKKKLREERRQMIRDTQEQINQMKPEHSDVVKKKDKLIEELADRVAIYEGRLDRAEHDLRLAETTSRTDQKHQEQSKASVEKSKKQVQLAEDKLREFNTYLDNVEGRHANEVVRLGEKIDEVKGNLQQQTDRLVNSQRENRILKDTLRVKAQLCNESNAEVEKLRKELSKAQAELGVADGMDEMIW